MLCLFSISLICACAPQNADEVCQTLPRRDTISQSQTDRNAPPKNISKEGMILIKGGTFTMGTNDGMAYEAPAHSVSVDSFWIDETETTVTEFTKFVAETGYITEAERFGNSGVFDIAAKNWKMRDGANWKHPEGADSGTQPDEPVRQVSWNDANAYARWAGMRLPTEAEWEFAARGGLKNKKYAWGDELRPNGKPVANWWQGEFPANNTDEDGFRGVAPVMSFAANGYGLYDVAGNVWEWTADWFDADYYKMSLKSNPPGAANGTERTMRGGSFLCAENFCTNYRVAGRSHSSPETGLNNVGFRCVRNAE